MARGGNNGSSWLALNEEPEESMEKAEAKQRARLMSECEEVLSDTVGGWTVWTGQQENGTFATIIEHPYATYEQALLGRIYSYCIGYERAVRFHDEATAVALDLPHADMAADKLLPGWFERLAQQELTPCTYKARCGSCDWCAEDAQRHAKGVEHVKAMAARHKAKKPAGRPRKPVLSPRQRQVVQGIAGGMTNLEISENLGCGLETVKSHVKDSLKKMGASNRAELAIIAKRRGQIK